MLMVPPPGFPEVAQLGRPIAGKRTAAFHPEPTLGAGTNRKISSTSPDARFSFFHGSAYIDHWLWLRCSVTMLGAG
jgi:hypothetical protein